MTEQEELNAFLTGNPFFNEIDKNLVGLVKEAIKYKSKSINNLEKELEIERMRLAACGAVAMCNTRESAAEARKMKDEYYSASCESVIRAVDAEMRLREENTELRGKVLLLEEFKRTATSTQEKLEAEIKNLRQENELLNQGYRKVVSNGPTDRERISGFQPGMIVYFPPETKSKESAKDRYHGLNGDMEKDPIERLRIFCSQALNGQDWLDIEPFFESVISNIEGLKRENGAFRKQLNNAYGCNTCKGLPDLAASEKVSKAAFRAVFFDRPEYFKEKKDESN